MAVYVPVDFALVRSNWVYRMFDRHGEALYVGKSAATEAHPDGQQLMQRLAQHLTDINPTHRKPWRDEVSRVDACAFDSEEEAALEEKTQIRRLCPKYNTALKVVGDTFPGLEW